MQNVCSDLSCFLLTMRELLQNFTIVSVCYTRTKKALNRFIKSLNLNLLFSKHENGLRRTTLATLLVPRDVTAAMLVVKNKSISLLWELNVSRQFRKTRNIRRFI